MLIMIIIKIIILYISYKSHTLMISRDRFPLKGSSIGNGGSGAVFLEVLPPK